MFIKTSRYVGTPTLEPGHVKKTRPRAIPFIRGIIEHRLTQDDRLDRLAEYYYRDPAKWWLILDANPDIIFGGELDMGNYSGKVIVIPADTSLERY